MEQQRWHAAWEAGCTMTQHKHIGATEGLAGNCSCIRQGVEEADLGLRVMGFGLSTPWGRTSVSGIVHRRVVRSSEHDVSMLPPRCHASLHS